MEKNQQSIIFQARCYATENIEGAPLYVGNCSGMWLREKSNNGAANEEEKSLENK